MELNQSKMPGNSSIQQEPDSTTDFDLESYMDYVEELPNDIARLTSEFREFDCQVAQKMQLLEYVSRRLAGDNMEKEERDLLMEKFEEMALEILNLNEEKLNCALNINSLITNKYKEFNIALQIHDTWELSSAFTPGKFNQCLASSTPIEPQEQKKIPRKRGRKPKNMPKDNVEEASVISVAESSTSCDLMMLAEIAVCVQKEQENSRQSEKFGKLPITKSKKTGPRKGRKRSKSLKESETENSDVEADEIPAEPEDNEPVYCLCSRPSFGNMVECSNEACSMEWFHFPCVSLKKAPKGRWYCPKCRSSNRNIRKMKKDLNS